MFAALRLVVGWCLVCSRMEAARASSAGSLLKPHARKCTSSTAEWGGTGSVRRWRPAGVRAVRSQRCSGGRRGAPRPHLWYALGT